jgi:conjugal transfer mating pair stabilization protein TraN
VGGWSGTVPDCESSSISVSNITFDTGYEPSTDFGVAASSLTALEEASKDIDGGAVSCTEEPPGSGEYRCTGEVTIFNGERLTCKKKVAGFSNCCNASGWGLGWATNCSPEEEQLRTQRAAGQCHYVGDYCSDRVLGVCTAKRYVYCCFQSKLGRIIHEQGRVQLGLTWGTARDPECGGLTPEQLQALDFEQIDFSEYFVDVMNRVAGAPDEATLRAAIDQYVRTLEAATCSQLDPRYPEC